MNVQSSSEPPQLDGFTHWWMGRLSPSSDCGLVALNSVSVVLWSWLITCNSSVL